MQDVNYEMWKMTEDTFLAFVKHRRDVLPEQEYAKKDQEYEHVKIFLTSDSVSTGVNIQE